MLTLQAVILAFALGAQPDSPADALKAAVQDTQALPAELRNQTRYLSLYHLNDGDQSRVAYTVSTALNAVSRARVIAKPVEVANGKLLRIDLAAYANLKEPNSYTQLFTAWERLASEDPYFHLRTQVATQEGLKVQTVPGGWAGLETAELLKQYTGSYGAVLRADWFIDKITRPPAYHEWLGIADTEAKFFKDIGLDLAEVNKLAADGAANIGKSKVTGKPRRIVYKPSPVGGVWITKDAAHDTPDKDPFRAPVDFKEQKYNFDATEIFYLKPNGFWGTVLFNKEGKRQDAVPPNIATDLTAPAGHQELVPMISCYRCHELNGGKSGFQPFKDEQTLLSLPDSYELAVSVRMQELYDPKKLAREAKRDQEDFEAAVFEATSVTPVVATTTLATVVAAYRYEPVTPAMAASEIGLNVDELKAALCESTDPTTKAIILGLEVTRGRFETAFQDLALHAQNYLISKGKDAPK